MKLFVSGSMARCAAELVAVNFKTAAYYFHRLRMIIDRASQDETPFAFSEWMIRKKIFRLLPPILSEGSACLFLLQ